MADGDFLYGSAGDGDLLPLSLSIFADDEAAREDLRRDAELAGFQPGAGGHLARILDDAEFPLGDCVLLHCVEASARDCAALTALDMRLAEAGRRALVSVWPDALEDVFACLDQSRPEILVAPNRAERLVALARLMSTNPLSRLHETDDDDRQTLQRLAQQVALIAERIEQLGQGGLGESATAFALQSPSQPFHGEREDERRLIKSRPPLPDPRLVRRIIRQRQLRAQMFAGDLFADPAWDILLDLTAARAEHTRVSVTSLCIASGVPSTTALRWIGQMIDAGLLDRVEDDADRRRAFIQLSDKAADAMARYFAELGSDARSLV